MDVTVVGWHIHPEAAKCDCGEPAVVAVTPVDDYWYFNLCKECLKKHTVCEDKIEEVFRNAGI